MLTKLLKNTLTFLQRLTLFWGLCLGLCLSVMGQTFEMCHPENQTVTLCQGTLVDSGDGDIEGDYDHNEDCTFTVCIPNAIEIIINVLEFETEETHDSLSLYVGEDLTGDLLLTMNGLQGASSISFNGEADGGDQCFTFHFYTDLAVTRPGFVIAWDAIIEQPPPIPPFTIEGVMCEDAAFVVELDAPILCEYVEAASFTFSGPNAPTIVAATPVDCVGGLTTSVLLDLSAPISSSGTYSLIFAYTFVDLCEDPHDFTASAVMTISDCPLEASFDVSAYALCGDCVQLDPTVIGGDGNYSYSWTPPLESGSTVASGAACPPTSTNYIVTVTDGLGQTDTAAVFVEVCPFEVSIPDGNFCEGDCIDITVDIEGGYPEFSFEWSASNPSAVSSSFIDAQTITICILAETSITVNVTDFSGNVASTTALMTVCPFDAWVDGPTEYCGNPISLVATAEGGSGEYSYLWSPGGATTPSIDLDNLFDPVTYSVTVTDVVTGEMIVINDWSIAVCDLTVGINGPMVVCNETANISATIFSGLDGDYTFNWAPPLNEGADVGFGTITIFEPTTYMLTVIDVLAGDTATAILFVDICPLQVIVAAPTYLCDELTDTTSCIPVTAFVEGGDGDYTYEWQPPFDTLVGLGPHFFCLTDTTYIIGLTVTDGSGNTDTDFDILENCPLFVILDAPNEVCDDSGYCAEVSATSFGGNYEYEYVWLLNNDTLFGLTDEGPHNICLTEPSTVSIIVTSANESVIESHDIAVCPFNVDIEIDSLFCGGYADTLFLNIVGGAGPYTISWDVNGAGNSFSIDETLPYEPFLLYHPNNNTDYEFNTFSVIITDNLGVERFDTAYTVFAPILDIPLVQTATPCANDVPVALLPNDGTWEGNGVSGNMLDPAASGEGIIDLTYYSVDNCPYESSIEVFPVPELGENLSACTGGTAFELPSIDLDGTWDASPYISGGFFDPTTGGTHTISYTTLNGCSNSIQVTVESINVTASELLVCSTPVELMASPAGGWWDATIGFDPTTQIFDPTVGGAGEYTMTYNITGGCSESVTVEVVEVVVEDIIQACPGAASTIFLPNDGLPVGGIWQSTNLSTGLLNENTGLYNPNVQGGDDYTEELVYIFDECRDTLLLEVVNTTTNEALITICNNEAPFELTSLASPTGGVWSGDGIEEVGGITFFNPQSLAPSTYIVSYAVNGCTSNINITVYPIAAGEDIIKCSSAAQFIISSESPPFPPGGTWTGPGIIAGAESIGIFEPAIADAVNPIVYTSPDGCQDTLTIFVNEAVEVVIEPFGTFLCYKDSTIQLVADPPGGVFSGAGVTGNTFNPIDAGPGPVLITYEFDNGCNNVGFYSLNVGPILTVSSISDTTICRGDAVPLLAFGEGGAGHNYTYTWDNGLGYGQVHNVSPLETTTYSVTVSDGCSEIAVTSVTVAIDDAIDYTLTTSPAVCYGEMGFAEFNFPLGNAYQIVWEHTATNSTRIDEVAGFYYATITDMNTGCSTEVAVEIPFHPLIYAHFETNENQVGCVKNFGLYFTDFSEGGTNGLWDFGDGTTQAYQFGEEVYHYFGQEGEYIVTLTLVNEGGCTTVHQATVCVEIATDILVPTAFSPNGDGVNDVFRAIGWGIMSFQMDIYNRWGEKVFQTEDITQGWDGIFNDEAAEVGVYVCVIFYSTRQDADDVEMLTSNITLVK